MAKSKEQKHQEAIDRNRKNLHSVRTNWARYQPGGDLYEHIKKYDGKEDADNEAISWDRKFTKAAQAAQTDRHGNPIDLAWRRLDDQIVVVRIVDTPDAWKLIVQDNKEKMFVQDGSENAFVVEYADHYEFDCARRRIGNRLYLVEYKVIRQRGVNVN